MENVKVQDGGGQECAADPDRGGGTNQGCLTHVEVGDVLSIQGLVDGQLSRYRVDDEDPGGGLVGPRAGHAVSEGAGLVVV